MKHFALSLAAAILAIRAVGAADGLPRIAEGADWSLPEHVRPTPYSGLFFMDSKSAHPLARHLGITFDWAMFNPAEGQYDFSELDKALGAAAERGGLLFIRLKCSTAKCIRLGKDQGSFIPPWVVEKHNPPLFVARDDAMGYQLYAAPWHEGVQSEYRRFIEEFGRRGYLADERFGGMYLHGVSSSFGEEFSLQPKYVANAEKAGMTAETMERAMRDRIDWWAEAAGPHAGKIAFVGAQGSGIGVESLGDYAWSKGLGTRGGFVEHYFLTMLSPPNMGQTWNDGYVSVDWSHPARDGRYYGDENEEDDEAGGAKGEALRFAVETPYFRAAQLGMRFLWVSTRTIEWAPEIAKWYTLTAGKRPAEAPDAVCWLREATVRLRLEGDIAPYAWKNLEHLLFQRDLDGARTVAARKLDLPYTSMKLREDPSEFSARRTDAKSGQREMVFFLHPEFRDSIAGAAQLQVYFLDDAAAVWEARVSTAAGERVLGPVRGAADGAWKTASFEIDSPIRPGALRDGADLLLRVEGPEDVTVQRVRIVKK